jgi:hypothetical protein
MFTVAQYNAICNAIGTGTLMVQYDGKRVQYHSLSDLMKAKAAIESDLISRGLIAAPQVAGVERGGTTFAAYCAD